MEEGEFSLSWKFKIRGDSIIWVYTGVYGPVVEAERKNF